MTIERDPETIVSAWLDEGPTDLPDVTRRAIAAALPTTTQRRRSVWAPWRINTMTPFARTATAVLIAAVAIGGAIYVLGPSVGTLSPTPTPSASPESTSTSSPAASLSSPEPTQLLGLEVWPGVQADGTIVFGLHDQATDSDRLYAIAPDGSDLQLLSDAGSCCLAVLHDGRAAAVGQDVDGRLVPAILGLPVKSSFSEEPWSDFAPGLNLAPRAWSRDANLAFEGWADGDPSKSGIYLSIANGGGGIRGDLRRLTSAPGGQSDIPIAFSPQGTELLFIRTAANSEHTGELYVIGLDGAGLRRLSPDGVGVTVDDIFGAGASWSQDGTRVAFSAYDPSGDGFSSLSRAYVVDVAGGDATAITPYSENMTSARWSPDGAWIAYDFHGEAGNDIWLVRPDGSDAHRITTTTGSCCGVWSPDSSMLVFEGNDALGAGMFVAHADGSGYSRLLTVDSEYDLRWRGWGRLPDRAP
ncbi:MAG TPA: hypothetical protein VFC71_11885 [Candidatus Polarisedimenticolia bacterium]|nr:hypothetical protein [Candidatus Polarisedimenticolia bacterium]